MALVPNPTFQPLVVEEDPDDYRPESRWSGPLVDPVAEAGYVRDLCVILEWIAPGDSIPLHTHTIDEVIVVESGDVELRLGEETRRVTGRSVAFVPAGTPHGARNVGEGDASYSAFFGSTRIDITYLERNPAPGTEADPPAPPAVYDARA
jgi:quercetin dioxygenase-like cupin family protein